MQYAVMLYFDDYTQEEINKQINTLKEYSNNEYMLENNMPAHITIAMFNADKDYKGEIKNFAKESNGFDLNFASVGFFNDNERHIFLAPIKSSRLIDIHSDIYNVIDLDDDEDYIKIYKDSNVWMPHVTIGYQVKEECFKEALGECINIDLPIKAKVNKIALAVCCPFKEIAVFDLG